MLLVAVLLAASVVGVTAQPKREEIMLAELVAMLGGSYDNLAQSRASSEHPALKVMVAPVDAPGVGDHVFYVQETAADDARRVLAQRLYVLNVVPKSEQAIMTQLEFNEPGRWRDGHLRP
jgi:predicted acyl esterase